MKILLVDPGTKSTGLAVWEKGAKTTWTARTDPKDELHHRLKTIVASASLYAPYDLVIMEAWERQFNPNMRYLIGALHIVEASHIMLVSPRKWVTELGVKGKNSEQTKRRTMTLAKKKHWDPETQHEADAGCLYEWWKKTQSNG